MRSSAFLPALLAPLSTAILTGISVPATLAPSAPYTITLLSENYIQAVADVAVAWGYATPASAYPRTLGGYTSSSYLGPDKSNQLENVTVETTAPAELGNLGTEAVVSVSLFSLFGKGGTPSVQTWNVTVGVGESVSGEVVSKEAVKGVA
ncbi:hypothetical protein CC80DRAFT_493403 [Byssothecium circinans]|uniref:Uncharacterized protein n=1 Tax=Byssothecium circinans TaxID=147558 RepID=A0A6A5TR10_9PLEO|nr:hypothetical protein CC80DRAFT_493403 [Byssothecium circinans]